MKMVIGIITCMFGYHNPQSLGSHGELLGSWEGIVGREEDVPVAGDLSFLPLLG